MDVLHTEVMDMQLKWLGAKICASYLDVWRKSLPHSTAQVHTHKQSGHYTHCCNNLPHQLFSTSQFIVCDLPFVLPAAAGLFGNSKQELCCSFPPLPEFPKQSPVVYLPFDRGK